MARRQRPPELTAAEHAGLAARLRLNAEGAEFLPQVTVDTGAGVVSDAREDDSSGAAAGGIVSITGEIPLYPGRERRGQKHLAESAVADADAIALLKWSEYRFRLRNAFIDLLYAQKILPVLDQTLQRRVAIAELVESRYRSGQESKGVRDVSRAVLAETRQEAAEAEQSLALCQRRLARLLVLEEPQSPRVTGELEGAVPAVTNGFDELAQNTPAYRIAACAARRAEGQVALARSRYGPQISAMANASPRSDSWAQETPDWFAGFRMTIPLYAGGRQDFEVSAAAHEREQVAAELQALRRDLAMEIEAACAECRSTAMRLQLAPDGLAAAELRSDIARREVEAGLSPLNRWEEAETDLARRQQAYLKARRDAARAQARWDRLIGDDAAERNQERRL